MPNETANYRLITDEVSDDIVEPVEPLSDHT